jgi:Transposase, Mutator family
MDDHLGYARHDSTGRNGGNSHYGRRTQAVIPQAHLAEISVPRDQEFSFDPRITGSSFAGRLAAGGGRDADVRLVHKCTVRRPG